MAPRPAPGLRLVDGGADSSGAFDNLDAIKADTGEQDASHESGEKPESIKGRRRSGGSPKDGMSSAANISLLLAKNLLRDMPNAEQYLAKFFPPITLIFGLLATDAHALPAYWHVWRESALPSKRGEFPEVRVPTSSRIPSETARTQLDRLAKKGLIEIVSRRPGAAIRVRLKRLAPEMVLPPSDEWPWPLD